MWTPTSVPGTSDAARAVTAARSSRRAAGFTLIELMVVLVIAGIVVSMVAIAGGATGRTCIGARPPGCRANQRRAAFGGSALTLVWALIPASAGQGLPERNSTFPEIV